LKQKLEAKLIEIDADSKEELGSYEEDYNLDDVYLAVRDYLRPWVLP